MSWPLFLSFPCRALALPRAIISIPEVHFVLKKSGRTWLKSVIHLPFLLCHSQYPFIWTQMLLPPAHFLLSTCQKCR